MGETQTPMDAVKEAAERARIRLHRLPISVDARTEIDSSLSDVPVLLEVITEARSLLADALELIDMLAFTDDWNVEDGVLWTHIRKRVADAVGGVS